jgi:hypothetical protein
LNKTLISTVARAIALCAALLLTVSACGRRTTSVAGIDGQSVSGGFIDDLSADAKNGLFAASENDKNDLSQMRQAVQSDRAEIYIGKYYDIAVLDKAAGSVWFSNPAIYDSAVFSGLSDSGKAETLSQVSLTYYDGANKEHHLSSFPDCVDGAEKDNVSVDYGSDELTVTYRFGEKQEEIVLCSAFVTADFEELDRIAQEKIADGLLTMTDYARFKTAYSFVVFSELTIADQTIYLSDYPTLKKLGELYILQKNASDVVKKVVSKVSAVLGVDSAYIQEELKKIGLDENVLGSQSAYFEIPVTYRLDGGDFLVSVDTAAITDEKDFYLARVGLLGNFGAALANQEGYVFIPDQSGAVIENTVTTTGQSYLDIPFYGTDYGVNHQTQDEISPYAPFPVFGVQAAGRGYFAVVESGDTFGGVTAQAPNGVIPYNAAEPWLTYYTRDFSSVQSPPSKKPDFKFSVRYHFLYGSGSGYSGMAGYYQNYLVSAGLLKKRELPQSLSLNLNFIGAIDKKQLVWGLPKNTLVAASALSDIQSFAGTLRDRGIGNVNYILKGAINGGLDYKIPSKAAVEKAVGGQKDYQALYEALQTAGDTLSLDIDYTKVYKSGNGLSQTLQISRYLDKKVATIADFDPALKTKDTAHAAYMINPLSYSVIVDSFIRNTGGKVAGNLFVSSVGTYLSSNFNDKSYVSRQQSASLSAHSLKLLEDAGYTLTVDGCNVYTLQYAGRVADIPVTGGNFALESYEVPFVGMVLHGYVDYYGPALNAEGNYELALLKNIESGAGLSYLLMTENPTMLALTKYSDMYNISAEHWLERIETTYRELDGVFGELRGCTITAHARLAENVFKTTYSNGTAIIVNDNDSQVSVDGLVLEGLSYRVVKP